LCRFPTDGNCDHLKAVSTTIIFSSIYCDNEIIGTIRGATGTLSIRKVCKGNIPISFGTVDMSVPSTRIFMLVSVQSLTGIEGEQENT